MLLQRTGKDEKPYNILSLDTEDSDGLTYVWSIQGVFNGRTIDKVFYSKQEAVKYLFDRRWPHTALTGVNLDYDLNTLKYKGGFAWHCIYNMGKLISAFPRPIDIEKHKLGRHSIRIIEIGNWMLNMSLKDICAAFEIPGHIDRHVLGRDGDKQQLIEACSSHARTGALAFDYIQNQIHSVGGRIKLTSSATALDLFMHKYLKKEHQIYDFKNAFPSSLDLPHDETDKTIIEEARLQKVDHLKQISGLVYVGGRTEAFVLGHINNVACIDINSSYPYEMLYIILPDMNTYKKLFPQVKDIPHLMREFEGCAHVEVTAPNLKIPLLHYKDVTQKLTFPIGTFSGWYTFPELRLALEVGYKINAVYEAAVFRPLTGFFTDYITDMYSIKENPHTKQAGKLLMNGLSGKFGQREPTDAGYEIYDGDDDVEIDNKEFFMFGDLIFQYHNTELGETIQYKPTAYPLISAYILANARIHLWKTMLSIGFEYCYYCDTDSIHADKDAVAGAVAAGTVKIHDTNIGAWSYDYKDATLDIRGLKYYRYHEPGEPWMYKMKGVRKYEKSTYWQYRKIWSTRVRKIKTAIRSRKRVNEFFSFYRHDLNPTPKRLFDDKGRSEPFEIFQ